MAPERSARRFEGLYHPRRPRGDVAGDGRGGHRIGVSKVELTGAGTAREVAVDRADGDFFPRLRHAWSRIDAGSARRLQECRAHALKDVQVPALLAVALHVLRPTLNEEAHPGRHPLTTRGRVRQHARIHIHVFLLPRGAGARVCDVDLDALSDVIDIEPVPGITRERDHRPDAGGVDLDDLAVLGTGVAGETGTESLRIRAR